MFRLNNGLNVSDTLASRFLPAATPSLKAAPTPALVQMDAMTKDQGKFARRVRQRRMGVTGTSDSLRLTWF